MYATNPTLNATGMRRPPARAPEFMAELDDIDDVVDVVDNGLDSVVPEGPKGEVEFESGSRRWRKHWHWQSAPGTALCHIRSRVDGESFALLEVCLAGVPPGWGRVTDGDREMRSPQLADGAG